MEKKFLIVGGIKEVQDLLDKGFLIENMVALHVANLGNDAYNHGKVAVYLIRG